MSAPLLTPVAKAFSAAAGSYDSAADLQRQVAEALARKIAGLPVSAKPRVLEIGCGTGFLTRAVASIQPAHWTITDLSRAMLDRCGENVGADICDAAFLVMDGESPTVDGPFDLICSSLAFQWFNDLPRSLGRLSALLAPGGHLAFATLGPETFKEWRTLSRACGIALPLRAFPNGAQIAAAAPTGFIVSLEETTLPRTYADGLAFLSRLRAIGAHRVAPDARPLSAGALRRVLRASSDGLEVSYQVITGILRHA